MWCCYMDQAAAANILEQPASGSFHVQNGVVSLQLEFNY